MNITVIFQEFFRQINIIMLKNIKCKNKDDICVNYTLVAKKVNMKQSLFECYYYYMCLFYLL